MSICAKFRNSEFLTAGRHYDDIFMTMWGAAWAASAKWNLDNESILDLELRKTRNKTWSVWLLQNIPKAYWITANKPALIMRNLGVPPVCAITLLLKFQLHTKSISTSQ